MGRLPAPLLLLGMLLVSKPVGAILVRVIGRCARVTFTCLGSVILVLLALHVLFLHTLIQCTVVLCHFLLELARW